MADNSRKFVWPSIGQERAAAFLEKSALAGKLAQTYIFAGPRDLGKASLALAFARNLWCYDRGEEIPGRGDFSSLDSDLYILEREPEKKQISVEQARAFSQRLGLSSFLNSYKIGLVKEAERLSPEAQSALLKTLEEPREKVIIILLAENIDSLLPTIVSRSQVLYFYPVAAAAVYDYLLSDSGLKRSLAKELAAASLGRPLQAKKWAEDEAGYQEHSALVRQLFDFLNSDLPSRLDMISAAGSGNNLSAETALAWIEIWESLWRDALLSVLNQEDRLQYPNLLGDWQAWRGSGSGEDRLRQALSGLQQLKQARTYVQGSVNPKNVLESLAIYF